MEFTVAALQIDERVECVQVDYEPSLNETSEAAALNLETAQDGAAAERFLLLAEGNFSIRVTSHCDVAALVRIDIDGVTGRGNFRLAPRGTIVIRAVQLQSGMHPTRLCYRKPIAPTNVKEVRDRHLVDDTNDADVTIQTLNASANIAEQGGYPSHVALLMDTMLLRVLFFTVKEVTGMWTPASTTPAAVMALRCGPASRLATHFGLPLPQNEILTRQLSAEMEELRRQEFDLARKKEDNLMAKLEPWKYRQALPPTTTHAVHDDRTEHSPVDSAAPRSQSNSGIIEGPAPVRGIETGPAAPPTRPAVPVCSKCSLHAAEKMRFLSEVAKWKSEAESWQAKYNSAMSALNTERMAARAGRKSLVESQRVTPRAADYFDGAPSNNTADTAAPPRASSAVKKVTPASAPQRRSTPVIAPTAERIEAARKRSLSPKTTRRQPNEVGTNKTPSDPSSDVEPKLAQPAPRKRSSPVLSTRPTRTSSTAPRPNKLSVKPNEKAVADWGSESHQWRTQPAGTLQLKDHSTNRLVPVTSNARDTGVGYVVDSRKAGPDDGMVLLRQDEVNALLDFAQDAHRFMEQVRTKSRESSAQRSAPSDELVDVPRHNGDAIHSHPVTAEATTTTLAAPPHHTTSHQSGPSAVTSETRTAQVIQNKRVISSLLADDDDDLRWTSDKRLDHRQGRPMAHIDYFSMNYAPEEVDMPPVLSPLNHHR